jgi:hypothetical protein
MPDPLTDDPLVLAGFLLGGGAMLALIFGVMFLAARFVIGPIAAAIADEADKRAVLRRWRRRARRF